MTLDDLVKVFHANYVGNGIMMEVHNIRSRAGVRAVVKALRDEIVPPSPLQDDTWEIKWPTEALERLFNDILGEPLVRLNLVCPKCGEYVQFKPPATDVAPIVCEWVPISTLDEITHYSTSHGIRNELNLWRKDGACPDCRSVLKIRRVE